MLKTNSKIKMLEFFYAIDKVFFGRPLDQVKVECCPLIKEDYLTLKGALISTLIEMSKLMEHTPKFTKKVIKESDLRISSTKMAKLARENAVKILSMEKGIKTIKENVKDLIKNNKKMNVTKAVQKTLQEKSFEVALDNLLIGSMIHESKSFKNLNTTGGQIIEGAYKIVRSSLVERAQDILRAMK